MSDVSSKPVQREAAAELDGLVLIASGVPAALSHLRQRRAEMLRALDELERAGVADAHAHYRDGKYLVLVHPQRAGARKREYIGSDPTKVATALARVDRAARRRALVLELERLDRSVRELAQDVARVDGVLRSLTRGAAPERSAEAGQRATAK